MSHMYLSICLWTNLSFSIARLRVYLSRGRLADRVERQRTQHSALKVGRWRRVFETPLTCDSHVSQRTRAGHYGYIPLSWTSLNIPGIHKKTSCVPYVPNTWDKQVISIKIFYDDVHLSLQIYVSILQRFIGWRRQKELPPFIHAILYILSAQGCNQTVGLAPLFPYMAYKNYTFRRHGIIRVVSHVVWWLVSWGHVRWAACNTCKWYDFINAISNIISVAKIISFMIKRLISHN